MQFCKANVLFFFLFFLLPRIKGSIGVHQLTKAVYRENITSIHMKKKKNKTHYYFLIYNTFCSHSKYQVLAYSLFKMIHIVVKKILTL